MIGQGFHRTTVTDANGAYTLSDVPAGTVQITTSLSGFQSRIVEFAFDRRPRHYSQSMQVGSLEETIITVSGHSPLVDTSRADSRLEPKPQAPSANVLNLQRRVAGVLPIRVDVPRAGTSHQFVRPLVIDEETQVTLRYKRR